MIFNSLEYFIFLAIVLFLYYRMGLRGQNMLLLVASYFFYGYWDWRFLGLILTSTLVDYYCGLAISGARSEKTRRLPLLVSVAVNLGVLGFFKYFNFFIDSAADLLVMIGLQPNISTLSIILPVGISFYTFQSLSYTIDVYRKELKPVTRFSQFALYVSFFPQLVAGPIERATHLMPQLLSARKVEIKDVHEGVYLILLGLFKKIVLADTAAGFVNQAFDNPDMMPSSGLFIAALLFSVQIYCDFSGYSDIARGTAKLLGIHLMVNFKQPYFSTDITEFWRRWHISLSTWLRDYLYIPLGGNRKGTLNTYRNLLITMLLGGLWHGAAWGFVIWGALHGLYLSLHKLIGQMSDSVDKSFIMIKRVLLFVLVSMTWIPFRQPDGVEALEYFTRMISFEGALLDASNPGKVLEPGFVFLLALLAILIIDVPAYLKNSQTAVFQWAWSSRALVYASLMLGVMLFGGTNEVAFIYFQF